MHSSLAILAALGFIGFGLLAATRVPMRDGSQRWVLPAVLSGAFFLFSLWAILQEGPTGFWPEHTRHFWGNQIWFDLLLAAGAAFTLMIPRMRRVGMNPLPWFVIIVMSGSIGIMAALARLLWLERRA